MVWFVRFCLSWLVCNWVNVLICVILVCVISCGMSGFVWCWMVICLRCCVRVRCWWLLSILIVLLSGVFV